jgi:DNA primase
MITPDTIQRVRDAARIEEVVGDFVRLRRRGSNLIGLCPFHNEKSPSFSVSPAKGIYKCFGCGKAGDSLRFLMDIDQLSYPDAIRKLADKYGIEIEEREQSPEEQEQAQIKETLFQVNEVVAQWFQEQMWETEEGQIAALSYFRERGFTDETIRTFRLGYAPKSWTGLGDFAKEKGYKEEYLQTLGLISKSERKTDVFRERVMFPILGTSGRVLGFGGRYLVKKENSPKYINSPESEIYQKREVLYGLFQAKQSIIKEDECYLVEGYTDVISLFQAGISNVVSSSGTSLTSEQIRIIRRFTKKVTLLYDGDAAGINASFRGIDMLLEEGMEVRVVLFSDGDDPDSFARKTGTDELKAFLQEQAQNFLAFKANILMREAGVDPLKKAEVLRQMADSLALIRENFTRLTLVQDCAQRMDVPEEMLVSEINKRIRKRLSERKTPEMNAASPEAEEHQGTTESELSSIPEPAKSHKQVQHDTAQMGLIRLSVLYGNHDIYFSDAEGEEPLKALTFILDELAKDDIQLPNPLAQQFLITLDAIDEEGRWDDLHGVFIGHELEAVRNATLDFLQSPYQLSQYWEERHNILTDKEDTLLRKTLTHSLITVKMNVLLERADLGRERLKNLQQEPKDADAEAQAQRTATELEILAEIHRNQQLIARFAAELSRVIIR